MEKLHSEDDYCNANDWQYSEDKCALMPCNCEKKQVGFNMKFLRKLGQGTCSIVYLAYLERFKHIQREPGTSNIQSLATQKPISLCTCHVTCSLVTNLSAYIAVKEYKKDRKYQLLFLKERRILDDLGKKSWDNFNSSDALKEMNLIKKTPADTHIIHLIGNFFNLEGHPCLILSFGHCSLKEIHLKTPKEDHKSLSVYMIQLLAKHILTGLKSLHSLNIIHGDLKPSNILWNGDEGYFIISDFSHSIVPWEKPMQPVQSCHYMAPEIYHWNHYCCEKKSDEQSAEDNQVNTPTAKIDIWSLGCILLEMTGSDLDTFTKCIKQKISENDKPDHKGKLESSNLSFDEMRTRTICDDSSELSLSEQLTVNCLQWSPSCRPTAENGLEHRFFETIYPPTILDMLLLPSKILQVSNIISLEVLQHLELLEVEDIFKDIRQECERFGRVISLHCPGYHGACHQNDIDCEGSVFIEFKNSVDCQVAQKGLMGRTFDGNTILTSFFPERKYLEKNNF